MHLVVLTDLDRCLAGQGLDQIYNIAEPGGVEAWSQIRRWLTLRKLGHPRYPQVTRCEFVVLGQFVVAELDSIDQKRSFLGAGG